MRIFWLGLLTVACTRNETKEQIQEIDGELLLDAVDCGRHRKFEHLDSLSYEGWWGTNIQEFDEFPIEIKHHDF